MGLFHRQFDQRKPAHSRRQILWNLYVQIISLSVWSFILGINIPILLREMKRSDPYGVVSWEIAGVIASFLMILFSAIFSHLWIRRLITQVQKESGTD